MFYLSLPFIKPTVPNRVPVSSAFQGVEGQTFTDAACLSVSTGVTRLSSFPPLRLRHLTSVKAPWRHCARASSAVSRPPSCATGLWLRLRISFVLWGSTAPSRWSRNGLGLSPAPQNSHTPRKSGAARRACWEVRDPAAVLCWELLEVGMFLIRCVCGGGGLPGFRYVVAVAAHHEQRLSLSSLLQSIINVPSQPVEQELDKCKPFLQKFERELRHFGESHVRVR